MLAAQYQSKPLVLSLGRFTLLQGLDAYARIAAVLAAQEQVVELMPAKDATLSPSTGTGAASSPSAERSISVTHHGWATAARTFMLLKLATLMWLPVT